MRLAASQPARL
ncbi:hypothetical protein EYF80_065716 [Liparis tanakae]|uniref:Uncharacterized protein n=1 Tax=Liparis tanakae TaxID=230148 RepID=A0A4Z2E5X3_9TELE|nr:hypothetical protein EYF80_065716 [Liparis tanakae]